jgi:hypothetical protein
MKKNNIKKDKLVTTEHYIEMVSKDYQFDRKHDEYCGFINIDPQNAVEFIDDYSDIAIQIAMNPKSFEKIANKYGLTIESAHEGELIFAELNPKLKVKSVF